MQTFDTLTNFVTVNSLLLTAILALQSAPADSVTMTVPLGEVSVTAIKSGRAGMDMSPVSATMVGESEAQRLGIITMKGVS